MQGSPSRLRHYHLVGDAVELPPQLAFLQRRLLRSALVSRVGCNDAPRAAQRRLEVRPWQRGVLTFAQQAVETIRLHSAQTKAQPRQLHVSNWLSASRHDTTAVHLTVTLHKHLRAMNLLCCTVYGWS